MSGPGPAQASGQALPSRRLRGRLCGVIYRSGSLPRRREWERAETAVTNIARLIISQSKVRPPVRTSTAAIQFMACDKISKAGPGTDSKRKCLLGLGWRRACSRLSAAAPTGRPSGLRSAGAAAGKWPLRVPGRPRGREDGRGGLSARRDLRPVSDIPAWPARRACGVRAVAVRGRAGGDTDGGGPGRGGRAAPGSAGCARTTRDCLVACTRARPETG